MDICPRQLAFYCLLVSGAGLPIEGAAAQSLTSGSLRGTVVDLGGRSLSGAQVSLERADGHPMAFMETDRSGGFAVSLVQPGSYRVLIEIVGYQPVRYTGVPVAAGQTTVVTARLEPRPPPIDRVIEVPFAGALGGSSLGPVLDHARLTRLDPRLSATDAWREVTEVDGPRDGSPGFARAAGGLPGTMTDLYVDGLPETLLRHPGVAADPAQAPLFVGEGLTQAQVIGAGFDGEWRGAPGVILAGHSARGGNALSFRPYLSVGSSALAAAAEDNPADSNAISFRAGGSVSGAIVPDTAHFAVRLDYQRLRLPAAYPWVNDTASRAGASVSLRETLPELGAERYGESLAGAVAPVVRVWSGFSGQGRFDWQIGTNQVLARIGYARWTETAPQLGQELSNLSEAELEANDLSGALSVTSSGVTVANELRIGFTRSVRDWLAPGLPSTILVGEGIAFGGSAGLPGSFERQAIDLSDAIQAALGRHQLKLGADLRVGEYQQEYRFGASGLFQFGSLDGFANAQGVYFQSVPSGQALANPKISEAGGFIQDTWSVSPEIRLLMGLRYDTELLPDDAIELNEDWVEATGLDNTHVPEDSKGVSPRAAFVWDVQNRGEWVLTGGAGIYHGRVNPALFAEAILFDGSTNVRRGIGSLDAWPGIPSAAVAPTLGPRLTLFNETYRKPRTFKAGAGVRRAWPGGLSLRIEGLYAHTDFLLRATDLNLVPQPAAETQEGRPVYGELVQLGGLITVRPGSNRRFDDFDLVTGLSPTGYADHQEITVALERRVPAGVSLSASYTFSRTDDNVLGQRSLDPADRLSPFPEGLDGTDWTDGRSDFDVPHRVTAYGEYRSGGATPIAVGARVRYRSGLPYTPGFRPGVDINGDGSGDNDPAYGASSTELSGLLASARCESPSGPVLARNACREDPVTALDAHIEVGLPVRFDDGSRLSLVAEAFNLVSSDVGLVDRALVLVNPNGSLTPGSGGVVTVPLVANPKFGQLLSRRVDPRFFRIGLRVGY